MIIGIIFAPIVDFIVAFSASGTPLDNAVAETFFATFKKEEAYRREYTSERHFRKSVDEYMRFY